MPETKDISFVAFEKRCINFDGEFKCPACGKLLIPVCVNLGMVAGKGDKRFYCAGHNFPADCSNFGCPKYCYAYWEELKNYRLYGRLEKDEEREEE